MGDIGLFWAYLADMQPHFGSLFAKGEGSLRGVVHHGDLQLARLHLLEGKGCRHALYISHRIRIIKSLVHNVVNVAMRRRGERRHGDALEAEARQVEKLVEEPDRSLLCRAVAHL